MGMRILGAQKAINRFTILEKGLAKAANDTVDEGTQHLMKVSQIQVPKKTGALSASARYIKIKTRGWRRIRSVKYGYDVADSSNDAVLDYAAAVHEILKASHKPPTKAKFVETPLIQGLASYKKSGVLACKLAVKRAFK